MLSINYVRLHAAFHITIVERYSKFMLKIVNFHLKIYFDTDVSGGFYMYQIFWKKKIISKYLPTKKYLTGL